MANTSKRRLVPYRQPPENLASDQRGQLLWLFAHEIRLAQQQRLTLDQLCKRLLTRLDLMGLAPGSHPAPRPAQFQTRRGWCDTHAAQLPCRGCAADRKATRDED